MTYLSDIMTILIAGTFNKVPPGHDKLISAAVLLGGETEISIASDDYTIFNLVLFALFIIVIFSTLYALTVII